MGGDVACLRGWHPALAKAELKTLLPNAEIRSSNAPRLVTVSDTTSEQQQAALLVASGLQCFLTGGRFHAWAGNQSKLLEEVEEYLSEHKVEGSVAVVPWRQEGKIKGCSTSTLAGAIGGILHRMGYSIDLEKPDHRMGLVADGQSESLAYGWMQGEGTASFTSRGRRASERPFFKPVSLDPRLARLAVNLAAGPVNSGPIVDPMTGTGGFIIEASLSGREGLGLDINSEMVQGANMNLKWAHEGLEPPTCHIKRGDATHLPHLLPVPYMGKVAGFVLDPPYGRNSHGSMENKALLEAVLCSAHDVANPSAGFVVILPIHPMGERIHEAVELNESVDLLHGDWHGLQSMMVRTGWHPTSAHVEHVHRSLSRLVLLARYAPLD